MFQLTTDFIIENCHADSFDPGMQYLQNNRIKAIQYNQERHSFSASVKGTAFYDVNLAFDTDGLLQKSSCTCPAYYSYKGFCKHIVAVLLMVMEKDRQGFFRELQLRTTAKHIFRFFQNRNETGRTPVQLEATFELKRESGFHAHTYPALSLRMGEEKLYVVKSIKHLLECMKSSHEIQFGKGFTFDPLRHRLREQDQPLLELLKEIYETDQLMDSMSYGYNRTSIFKDRVVRLTDSSVKRFLQIYTGRSFRASILDEFEGEIIVLQEDLPIHFSLQKDANDLVLGIDLHGSLIPLTEGGEYFYWKEKVYRISQKQQVNFKPFYMAMAFQQGKKLRFIEEDKERFVSEILPFAEKAGVLHMDEKVTSILEKLPLDAEMYLDREGGFVSAEVKFNYGSRTINPFTPTEKQTSTEEKILIRDIAREELVLDLIGRLDFKVRNTKIYLDGDDKIFDFVFKVLPRLQEHLAVYYSESFKTLTVKAAVSISGRVRLDESAGLLEFSFDTEGINRRELKELFSSLEQKKRYYRLKDGRFLNLEAKELRELAQFFTHLGINDTELESGSMQLSKYRAVYLDQNIRDFDIHQLERNHTFKEFVQNIREPEDMEFEIPQGINGKLREYQKFGFKWLKTLAFYNLGGILADDMGLGKTLQVITLILSEKENNKSLPSLVVVPTSLVYNWCAEIERFAPELKVTAIAGSKGERRQLIEAIQGSDVVITSYPLIRRDIEMYEKLAFRYCILDEAQHIKNPQSQNAQSVKSLRADVRFALTGTPMENNLTELWSIFDFILPGYLYSHTRFVQRYESPISKSPAAEVLEDFGRLIRPFILRRLKKDVLSELPDKIEHRLLAELTKDQKKVYLAHLEKVRNEIEKEIEDRGFERSHIKILAALTRLRQICCHPGLFIENYAGGSGKLELLQEIITDSVDSGHRILLFSQFTSMLSIIESWLKTEGLDYFYLDGSTPAEARGVMVNDFNDGQGKVFLISLRAGGTGLNLTGADTVIHFDPWWNPAVEDQATDRAYRIGQTRSVHVMKLIAQGTIEEKIYAMQERKKQLIDSVIQPGDTLLSKLTREEIRQLFE